MTGSTLVRSFVGLCWVSVFFCATEGDVRERWTGAIFPSFRKRIHLRLEHLVAQIPKNHKQLSRLQTFHTHTQHTQNKQKIAVRKSHFNADNVFFRDEETDLNSKFHTHRSHTFTVVFTQIAASAGVAMTMITATE